MKYNILDCTLRDGGYITNWKFENNSIKKIIAGLVDSNIDYIECGYLNSSKKDDNSTIFNNIDNIQHFLPDKRNNSSFLAMADVAQYKPSHLIPRSGNSVDGIRVVFYKHQIDEALQLCKCVKEYGYKLFVQPMVTIDYTLDEYTNLSKQIAELNPYAVSIVDSFGYMNKEEFRKYFKVLDNILNSDASIDFHSHNNMQLAFITAQDIFDYQTNRQIIIDSSLYGMGRGAGNLNTELITNYYNMLLGKKYDISILLKLMNDFILPIYNQKQWGYSPYLFLTGLNHCHPNFASYLLDYTSISITEFEKYLKLIPEHMKTKCKREYVENLYNEFIKNENN